MTSHWIKIVASVISNSGLAVLSNSHMISRPHEMKPAFRWNTQSHLNIFRAKSTIDKKKYVKDFLLQ